MEKWDQIHTKTNSLTRRWLINPRILVLRWKKSADRRRTAGHVDTRARRFPPRSPEPQLKEHTRMSIQRASFYVLLVIVTVAFVWLLIPYYTAILWAVILAILFFPVHI